VAREVDLEVDETGFKRAMEEHKVQSGAGKAFGSMGGEDVEVYRGAFENWSAVEITSRRGRL